MRKLRICQLITELEPAGAERSVYELARRLDRSRFDCQVVALRGGRVGDWLAEAGIKVTIIGVRGKWDLGKLVPLTKLLGRERFDIVHTHLFHADLAGRPAARLAAVPHLIHTLRTAEGRFRPWQFAYCRLMSGYCDRIVSISDSARYYHARRSGLPLWRYEVINNGVDASAYARCDTARAQLRRQWGIARDDVLAAYVGRLDRAKGIETLVGAFSHLGARGNPVNIVVAGDGPRRSVVENYVEYGEGGSYCRLLGFTDDVRGVLSAADMFVMPSRWEGFGLAAVEAMAAGLPVVATRATGLCDVIADGETGMLVEINDVVALADAIHRLAADAPLRERLGSAGRQRAIEKYSIADTIAAHERLYLQVAADVL